ncbi:MAG TPA: hypothetical protein VG738_00940 [Chitinophagaceae bacterium]|nr:hypothetical protein [Chitinophagaceae bacterium]
MKKFYIVAVFFCIAASVNAQAPANNIPSGRSYFHERIDMAQKSILKLDGVEGDVKIAATDKIDNLQASIESDAQLDNTNKIKFLRGLEETLEQYAAGCSSNRYNVDILPAVVSTYKDCIHLELNNKSIAPVIAKNGYEVGMLVSNNFAYNKNVGHADAQDILLVKYLRLHPESIISTLSAHPNLPDADSLIIAVAHKDPEIIYIHAQAFDGLAEKIHSCNEKLVSIINRMAQMRTGRQFFPFLDEIYAGNMTFEQVDSAIDDGPKYFKLLVQAEIDYADRKRNGQKLLVKNDMDEKISTNARDLYINEINALHESPDNVRFRVIENLSPEELYYLAVSSEEEIYTSSYVKGVYPRIWRKISRSDSLLMNVRFDHFKKWIKMAANYNTLDDFLKRMDKESSQILMKAFVKGLDRTQTLEDAVDVANSYGSIKDKEMRKLVLNEVQYNLQKAKSGGNTRGTDIYNILNILFLSMDSTNHVDVSKLLGVPPVYYVPNKNLQDSAGRIIVQQFFYGDADGKEGYAQFTSLFDNGNWKMTGNDQWVVHTSTSKGTKVVIYSNRPLDEKQGLDDKAQKALCDYLNEHGLAPTIVIHRGHSYYLRSTLERLEPSAQIVVLGSCGAYQSLNKVLTLCPTAHIVASKQTGSQRVNGPLIKGMMDILRQGKTLYWQSLWRMLNGEIADKELFNDYIPPYKNLGALFIMAYNKMAHHQ